MSVTKSSRVGSDQPFARDQAKPFSTGPYLGGYLYVLLAAAAAGGTVTFNHGLKVPPRHVEVVAAPNTYPSPVYFTAVSAQNATAKFQTAQPIGTVLWIW